MPPAQSPPETLAGVERLCERRMGNDLRMGMENVLRVAMVRSVRPTSTIYDPIALCQVVHDRTGFRGYRSKTPIGESARMSGEIANDTAFITVLLGGYVALALAIVDALSPFARTDARARSRRSRDQAPAPA